MSADEPRSPVDARLDEHLALLRTDAPSGDRALAARIARAARWQGAVRARSRLRPRCWGPWRTGWPA